MEDRTTGTVERITGRPPRDFRAVAVREAGGGVGVCGYAGEGQALAAGAASGAASGAGEEAAGG
ncbi:hypothetical protein Smic_44300 [Streptomyces microflavus]|uniref:Uncharacterized protein n=1 Tax=Streptomyces microflavus TaxID=1919 RepID=A0A7J0CVE8_STRMI|nr:hypothetical protein Smic_44300 [Streptomyces microflavus]